MVVDGVELLRMIRDGEIKEDTDIKDTLGNLYTYKKDEYNDLTLYECDLVVGRNEIPDYTMFTDKENKFEILSEEDEEIDIQALQETQKTCEINNLDDAKIIIRKNEDNIKNLIKAIKQLDKKIK